MVFLFILAIVILLIVFSKIKIQIDNVKFISKAPKAIGRDYKIVVKWCVLGILPIIKINITKTKLEKLRIKEKFQNLEIKLINNEREYDKKFLEKLKLINKKLNINIRDIKLKIEIGTENAGFTAIIIGIMSMIIGIYLSQKVRKPNEQKFEIIPKYINQNLINILFSGIFEIKMIHIINIIYILAKREGEDKNERTSNRRTYDYSYE